MSTKISIEKCLNESECWKIVENVLNLNSTKEIALKECKLIPVSKDILGYLGEYFNLYINADVAGRNKEFHLFVKTVPLEETPQKKWMEELGVFSREVEIFDKLIRPMDKLNPLEFWHGKCYYFRENILVMEDLKRKGYDHGPHSLHYTNEQIKSILRTLASLHANSIALENTTKMRLTDLCQSLRKEFVATDECAWLLTGMKAIKAMVRVHPNLQDVEIKQFMDAHFDEYISELFERQKKLSKMSYRNVLCHRDLWDKNILFKSATNDYENPDSSLLIDFQICSYHPPALDVATFIYINTSVQMRQTHLRQYLNYYYECLRKAAHYMQIDLETEISRNAFEESYKYCELIGLLVNGSYTPFTKLPDGYMNKIKHEDSERHQRLVTSDRDEFLLDYMEKDSAYREFVQDTIEEIVLYLIKMRLKADDNNNNNN